MNNYEYIKQMTVEQFSELLSNCSGCDFCYKFTECNEAVGCEEGIKQWLLEEYKND